MYDVSLSLPCLARVSPVSRPCLARVSPVSRPCLHLVLSPYKSFVCAISETDHSVKCNIVRESSSTVLGRFQPSISDSGAETIQQHCD